MIENCIPEEINPAELTIQQAEQIINQKRTEVTKQAITEINEICEKYKLQLIATAQLSVMADGTIKAQAVIQFVPAQNTGV